MLGYVDCECCGITFIGLPGEACDGCRSAGCDLGVNGTGETVATAENWHCFTAHCDGSGCSYPGECERG